MRAYTKYTRELLEPLVKDSISVAEVLRKLGKRQTGSISTHLSRTIKRFGLDTTHFLGKASNSGSHHRGGPQKKSWQERLVKSAADKRQKSRILRRALIESGRKYECEKCLLVEWNRQPLILEIDHKNGDWADNRPNNLRFLCPNCHSQTRGYANRGNTQSFVHIAQGQSVGKTEPMAVKGTENTCYSKIAK